LETQQDWPLNYFNYFTEVEEHFQRARGTGLFLLSPLDWALIETWKNAEIPLDAVLRGIDAAFEKWRAQKKRRRMVNSLAYCTQAVVEEAERMADAVTAPAKGIDAPFPLEELRLHLQTAADAIQQPELATVRQAIEALLAEAEQYYTRLEALEQQLAALEDKMIAVARAQQNEADLIQARAGLEAQVRPYRGKMTAPQLAMLEKQYLDRWLLEKLNLPRLSLFYIK